MADKLCFHYYNTLTFHSLSEHFGTASDGGVRYYQIDPMEALDYDGKSENFEFN